MTNTNSKLLHLLFLTLIICIGTYSLSAPVMAEEASLPANITLKLPELKLSDELEEEVSHLSFESVLEQVEVDDETVQIITKINEAIADLQDIEANVEFVEIRGDRREVVSAKFFASLKHKVVRMEFSAPSALRGQIFVADQNAMEVRMYTPVNNHITIQRMEDMSNQAANSLNLTNLDIQSLFDFSHYAVELVDYLEEEGVTTYTLRVTGFEDQVQLIRVKSDTFIPDEILEYENDILIRTLNFTGVKLDQDLSAETIAKLPAVREMRL